MNVSLHAQEKDSRIEELDKKLKEARQVAVGLQKTIDSLTDELEGLRKSGKPHHHKPWSALHRQKPNPVKTISKIKSSFLTLAVTSARRD